MSFYEKYELKEIGLKSFGENVLISKKCSIYGAENISIGNNVRIDDFCILSGNIIVGNYVHIAAGSYIFAGDAGVEFEDFSGISSKVNIYAISDQYSGNCLTNPTVPEKYREVIKKRVILKKHSLIGSNSVILPGVSIGEGVVVGAASLVTKSLDAWGVYVGSPVKFLKKRSKRILELEKELSKEFM